MNRGALKAGGNPLVIAMDLNGEGIPLNKQDNFYKDPSSKLPPLS